MLITNRLFFILISNIYTGFLISCTYFCLWVIGDYLLNNKVLALLFLPFYLRIGILLHINIRFWFITLLCEWFLIILIYSTLPQKTYFLIYLASLITTFICYGLKPFYLSLQQQWKKLSFQLILIILFSILNCILFLSNEIPTKINFIVNLTGGLLLLPFCYLIKEYVFNHHWVPITANLVHKPLSLRTRHISLYILLFLVNIYIQMKLPITFSRFSIFCLAIPIILLAFHYGWQGALLATLLNSIALIATNHNFSNIEVSDLLLTLSAQTVTGIFLGLAIQHQRDLHQSITTELLKNKLLTKQLINTEEAIRKEIARELHDEIGQNITAIRTQANIIKRLDKAKITENYINMIELLSSNVYDTTKSLLNRLRPKLLDDLDLYQSIQSLFINLGFEKYNIKTEIKWYNPNNVELDPIIEITLYRLCQEALNNIIKYAKANKVTLSLHFSLNDVQLMVQDNGIGFDPIQIFTGYGIKGMQERTEVLNGEFHLSSTTSEKNTIKQGTIIKIRLPLNNNEK
ncbi:signal transduction histidine-protein kinase/phosphatase UhpB [Volucribacter amazonae]|uniref:Histidine kinase domain-containing protein n=1 Tax=Volucribacter amazonae TaxID=256731 RepID=A0A9X4PCF3_9PAST|nr:signal transduction histidine-protein kinase/phosphatase UhpB [Volucribacter amazonae]MDG6895089.1 hypothetical protein [Volucribacter amazonae]